MTTTSLLSYSTFAVDAQCNQFVELNSTEQLNALPTQYLKSAVILGGGSNIIFVDNHAPNVIKVNLQGIEITECENYYQVTAAAGENWHQLVTNLISQGIYGAENLALIPGSVGAAPVQNIGAYGVEFKSICASVTFFDFNKKQFVHYENEACEFGYRTSIFKTELKNKGIITEVTLRFTKQWQPITNYVGLNEFASKPSAQQIYEQVVNIRKTKLPDPKVLPNCGSFFKNPIVSKEHCETLLQQFPNMPHYPVSEHQAKLPAAWLIEQCQLKGFELDGVAVDNHHALVIVNKKAKHGAAVVKLAKYIINEVWLKFNILLENEVRLIGRHGEITLTDGNINE